VLRSKLAIALVVSALVGAASSGLMDGLAADSADGQIDVPTLPTDPTVPTVPELPSTPQLPTAPEVPDVQLPGGGDTDGSGGGSDTAGGGTTGGGTTDTTTGGGAPTVDTDVEQAGGGGATGGVSPDGKGKGKKGKGDDRIPLKPPPEYTDSGVPTRSNPTATIATFGPAPIGVPNFVIDQFEIPPFLLPLYQACGTQYGIPWEVLASINKIETAFGTNLNVSSAGALGWMQFIPSTWQAYGVDANGDGDKDPYNPVDAICAAARYLRAAGGEEDLRTAIFAYNHADWYVDEVLLYANGYGEIPEDLLGSLTGLTEGAHFPVAANARYADDISAREVLARAKPSKRAEFGNAADIIESSPTRRGINIFSREGAPIIAVNDGVITRIGKNDRLGRFVVLRDAYGNRFTYAEVGAISPVHPVPKPQKLSADDFKLVSPPDDAKPDAPATVSAGDDSGVRDDSGPQYAKPVGQELDRESSSQNARSRRAAEPSGPVNTEDMRPRLYALPARPHNVDRASLGGQINDLAGENLPGYVTFRNYFDDIFGLRRKDTELRPLREGSKVIAGTVLGRMAGSKGGVAPHINFSIRPAGRGAPRIDPKPILDGWKLLEATAIYRAAGKNPFATDLGVGGVLLMSKEALIRRVLADPRLEIYSCGRTDIRTGQISRQVLAALEYLVEKGFHLTITSLKCGHSFLTASGNVSNHSSGNAVDIAEINGIPVLGNQGPGTLTHAVLLSVLQLQGTMVPEELISLESLGGPSFALSDHADHVHIGWQPIAGENRGGGQFVEVLKPDQWQRLIDRLADIDNPTVPVGTSDAALPAGKGSRGKRASDAHVGE
jgi:murein DD-endopeptidase MepM/ murein hydrolase activator NlpD